MTQRMVGSTEGRLARCALGACRRKRMFVGPEAILAQDGQLVTEQAELCKALPRNNQQARLPPLLQALLRRLPAILSTGEDSHCLGLCSQFSGQNAANLLVRPEQSCTMRENDQAEGTAFQSSPL